MNLCDEWEGPTNGKGYGSVYVTKTDDNKSGTWNAHRLMWMQTYGPIPRGYVVMHLCDNPKCINIEHLRLGTQSDNMFDKVAKGRTHNTRGQSCTHGHPWVSDNIYVHPSGQWHCLTCRKQSDRRRRAPQKAQSVGSSRGAT